MKCKQASTLLLAALTLAGCSSQPLSFGETLGMRSAAVASISKQWNAGSAEATKGQNMVDKGNKLLAKAQKEQEQGQKLVTDGQALLVSGKQKMSAAEAAYGDLNSTPIAVPAPAAQN